MIERYGVWNISDGSGILKLGEEFAPGNYRAKAVFSDGSESDILIQKKDGKVNVRF